MNRKINMDNIQKRQEQFMNMNPVDIAEIFNDLENEEIAIAIKLLDKDILADTFAELNKEKKEEVISLFTDDNIISLMQELDEDELVDTIQELPASLVKRIMVLIDDERRPIINTLLGYPEESIGSVMSVNFITSKISASPQEIIDLIKNSDIDSDKLEIIWITGDKLNLIGFVYLADLIRTDEEDINSIIRPLIQTVSATDDQEVAAKLATKYDLTDIPVVDSENRLIGTIPTEWALDILMDEYQEDMDNISGITEAESDESYLDQTDISIAKTRTTWLAICLITATLTGFIIQRYEETLAASVALAAYIPMLMDSGGNAGSQASTTVIKSLYTGEIDYKNVMKVIFKESRIGIMVGIVLVIINFIKILLLDTEDLGLALTVSITLLITIVLSKIIGGILPLIADKFKLDPTVMAGPIITTIVDTVALLIYFEVASMLIL